MHKAQHGIAVLHIMQQHPEGHDVVHLVKRQVLLGHLFMDAGNALDASHHLALEPVLLQQLFQARHHLVGDLALHDLVVLQPLVDLGVGIGLEIPETDVLQLLFQAVQAQAVGQRDVDIHRFLGDALLLVGDLKGQGMHVVQTIRQLDHEYPDIVRHGQNHLADVLRMGFFLGIKRNEADLGDSVHDVRHIFAEVRFDFLHGAFGVFHGVVQQSGAYGGFVKTEFGKRMGHRQRMGKIGFAGKAHLSRMRGSGIHIGFLDQAHIGVLIVRRELVQNFLDADHAHAVSVFLQSDTIAFFA